jgi:hypothetical protein
MGNAGYRHFILNRRGNSRVDNLVGIEIPGFDVFGRTFAIDGEKIHQTPAGQAIQA